LIGMEDLYLETSRLRYQIPAPPAVQESDSGDEARMLKSAHTHPAGDCHA